MGNYSDRPKELRERLEQQKAAMSADEVKRIAQVIDNYESARNDSLMEFVQVLADNGSSERGSDAKSKLDAASQKVTALLGGMLDGLSNTSASAGAFEARALYEDGTFFKSLADLDLGGARDALVRIGVRFDQKKKELEEAWDKTSDEEKRVEDIERQAALDINKLLRTAVNDQMSLYANAGQYSYQTVEKCKNIPKWVMDTTVTTVKTFVNGLADMIINDPEAPKSTLGDDWAPLLEKVSDPGKDLFQFCKDNGMQARDVAKLVPYLARNAGMIASDNIEDLLKAIGTKIDADVGGAVGLLLKMLGDASKYSYGLLAPWTDAQQRYWGQMPGHGTILICFSNARKVTDDFIQNNGFDAFKKYYESVQEELDGWCEHQGTDGLKKDAEWLREFVMQAFRTRGDVISNQFQELVKENTGAFIGPVDQVHITKLVDPDWWNSQTSDLKGVGLDDRLKQWRDQIMTLDDTFDGAFRQIQDQLAGLPIVFQAAVKDRLDAKFKDIKAQLADARKQTVDGIAQQAKLADKDQLAKTFDRTQLLQAIR